MTVLSPHILEMRNITKAFPGVKALDNVTLAIRRGEIHALVGENGAGKSTLMKVIAGVFPYGTYEGDIIIDGEIRRFDNVKDSELAGIAVIYQEPALVKTMNICENLFLGEENATRGIIDWNASFKKAAEVLREVGLDQVSPATRVLSLQGGMRQLVHIARALLKKNDLLILDEPTAALSAAEAANLLDILRRLRDRGVTCIFISHRLGEVVDIADRVTVLRDGKTICTLTQGEYTEDDLITTMAGREVATLYPRRYRQPGDAILEIRDWTVVDPSSGRVVVDQASFTLRRGEILALSGLVGAGRTELAMSLFGLYGRVTRGKLLVGGMQVRTGTPHAAIKAGLGLVSEDRQRYGLVPGLDIMRNISLAALPGLSRFGVVRENEEILAAQNSIQDLHIKSSSLEQKAGTLSGGNQQKVVIGKWLMTRPKVLIMDEPTRGIDVGAKAEMYGIMDRLARDGVGVLMISSELPEVLGMADRIVVMSNGSVTGILTREEADQETVMAAATARFVQAR